MTKSQIKEILSPVVISVLLFVLIISCKQTDTDSTIEKENLKSNMEYISKPYARYWWFASEIQKEDVKYNLDWLKENGFGGIEIAWVYPLNGMDKSLDTSYTPRYQWLGSQWQQIVNYTILYADSIGLGCDMTMGTLWPFGDSHVSIEQATQIYGQEERQKISRSWEYPVKGYVVDHLNPKNYLKYFKRIIDSFPQPKTNLPQSYFVDSWEVESKHIWADGFEKDFQNRYGYDIRPFMDSIYETKYQHQLYDYMKLISSKVIGFYKNFDSILNDRNIFSRGQCSGAPCDLISAYASLDIPEGESMLYEPEYNSIPASAAALSSKKVVSAETFTCLYGWPRNHIREEQTADLKLVADALFANGINHIVWHGKAHNHKDQDTTRFYASVHIGKDGSLAAELPAFNKYLSTISKYMKKGNSYADVAVYLPTEDSWIKGIMPKEKQFIWAWGYYEMRYVYFPEEVKGHHPIWINKEFLEKAQFLENEIKVGDISFNSLYFDSHYLDYDVLVKMLELAKKGAQITLKRTPLEAGVKKHQDWNRILDELYSLPNVLKSYLPKNQPLVDGNDLPSFWAREYNNSLYIFFANPKSKHLAFPLEYGQSYTKDTLVYDIVINYHGKTYNQKLIFEPYASLLFKVENDIIEQIDIEFTPKTPEVKKLTEEIKKPWLVK